MICVYHLGSLVDLDAFHAITITDGFGCLTYQWPKRLIKMYIVLLYFSFFQPQDSTFLMVI